MGILRRVLDLPSVKPWPV